MAKQTQGERVYLQDDGELHLKPGQYGIGRDGRWYARPPVAHHHLGCLDNHEVTDNTDGTITVKPSILVETGKHVWHGFLEGGVWREC